MNTQVREPAVAGLFYEDRPAELEREVRHYLSRTPGNLLGGTIRGLISPHAGLMYSGWTAAHAYRQLQGIHPGTAFRTPLGDVPIHDGVRAEIASYHPSIELSAIGHRSEHSVEVQLPFLQEVLGRFSFVPVVMGEQRKELCYLLADALVQTGRRFNLLLVASSDLSHYHPYEEAVRLDRSILQDIESYQTAAFMEKLEDSQAEACGGGPIIAVMKAASDLGASVAHILHYCNSGDVSPRRDAVVGYVAAALVQE
jgi:AmmeMemoRadiSam system protein B